MTPAASSTALLVIRGNSGSGKSTVAREVRRRYGRGCALLEQDYLRRIVLREHDSSNINPVAPGFIAAVTRTALDAGYHAVLEGILHADRYGPALRDLIAEHPGPSHLFYLDVSYDETVRRHAGRAAGVDFTADDMRDWYAAKDLLGVAGEHVIGEDSTFEQTVTTILHTSGLAEIGPTTPCPSRCPRCFTELEHAQPTS
ncbi:AAA family ATPase [Actinoplanes sp. NPDC051346]|uniref:AAA family ATPase n=1 Tax=Actinoplanes sp. NPDC051346 TaxID=3155048 RepID=UPI0034342777